jgi:hypothetical protein
MLKFFHSYVINFAPLFSLALLPSAGYGLVVYEVS